MVRVKNIHGKDITNILIIEALPSRYKNPLKKPTLKKLTFGDFATVYELLRKSWQKNRGKGMYIASWNIMIP